jgi:hypothetical protein
VAATRLESRSSKRKAWFWHLADRLLGHTGRLGRLAASLEIARRSTSAVQAAAMRVAASWSPAGFFRQRNLLVLRRHHGAERQEEINVETMD